MLIIVNTILDCRGKRGRGLKKRNRRKEKSRGGGGKKVKRGGRR